MIEDQESFEIRSIVNISDAIDSDILPSRAKIIVELHKFINKTCESEYQPVLIEAQLRITGRRPSSPGAGRDR